MFDEVPGGPEDRVERLGTTEPAYFNPPAFSITGLHVPRDRDKLFYQPLLQLRWAQSESCNTGWATLHLIEQVINLPAKIEAVQELTVERGEVELVVLGHLLPIVSARQRKTEAITWRRALLPRAPASASASPTRVPEEAGP